ncbi:MAG: hypothetical protein ACI4RD_01985 [Kiritimatiellia bacterium]
MKIISLLFAATCIVAGSVERKPADEKTSSASAAEVRGVVSALGVMTGPFDSRRQGGFVIFVR